ncbi:MAG: hypothetical protein IT497_06675 [Ottowia sp.]|nr:hypothetical protein [Ottowia sp.]
MSGYLNAEIKREAITLHQGAPLSQPGQKLSQEQQTLLQKTSLYAGNSDIQYANTGARGNKALHGRWTWQYFIGLSLSKRLGSKPAWQETQGLSKYINI